MPNTILFDDTLNQATRNFGNMTMTGLFNESFTDGLTAHAGGSQAAALLLTSEINRITTVATAADSVMLPAALQGLTIFVINHGTNAMQVYGNGTDVIDDVASATGVSQMIGSMCLYTCPATGKWYSDGLGTGYSGSLQTSSFRDAITAHAGGTQAGAVSLAATIMSNTINRITVVASAADSIALPVSAPGLQVTCINASASNAMQVFGQSPDTINAVATATGVSVPATKTANFYCVVAGAWHMLLSN